MEFGLRGSALFSSLPREHHADSILPLELVENANETPEYERPKRITWIGVN